MQTPRFIELPGFELLSARTQDETFYNKFKINPLVDQPAVKNIFACE